MLDKSVFIIHKDGHKLYKCTCDMCGLYRGLFRSDKNGLCPICSNIKRSKKVDAEEGPCIGGKQTYKATCSTCGADRGFKDKTRLEGECSKCANKKELEQKICPVCSKEGKFKTVKGMCELCYKKEYYSNNKQKIEERRKQYQTDYYNKNKNKKCEQQKRRSKARRQTDPMFRLATNLRNRFKAALRGVGFKRGSAVRDLGCTLEELKIHIESKFKSGMTWENYGEWEIDHIKPISLFDLSKAEDQLAVNHYTNLQPMWLKENRSKSNKYSEN